MGKVPRNRAGRPLNPPKEPLWTRHARAIPNGYIVRVCLNGGYKVYRPELLCRTTQWYRLYGGYCPHTPWGHGRRPGLIPSQPHRRIQLDDDYSVYWPYHVFGCACYVCKRDVYARRSEHSKTWQNKTATRNVFQPTRRRWEPTRELEAGSTTPRRCMPPAPKDDPIEAGREIATSRDVLPSDRWRGPSRGVSTMPMSAEEKEIDELYRAGILYDNGAPGAEFGLAALEHDEPCYTIRVVPKKGKKNKKNKGSNQSQAPTQTTAADLIVDTSLQAAAEVVVHLEDLQDDGWDLGPFEDDAASLAESWILMEDSEPVAT